jgi:hypothetical protein
MADEGGGCAHLREVLVEATWNALDKKEHNNDNYKPLLLTIEVLEIMLLPPTS